MRDGLGWLAGELGRLEGAGLRRLLRVLASPQEPEVVLEGRRVVLLCSNNYLGLAADPRVRAAAARAALRWGAGSGASRLVSGTTELHRELEGALAAHKGCEDAVLFSSGYLANLGTIPALVGAGDVVFSDALNHASIIDGCRLAKARCVVYRHADPGHLEELLRTTPARRRLVVTDTVFSMDGDLAPLPELVELCERHHAMLMVDEAHATGVLGPRGGGAVEAAGLGGRVDVVMGTLSKALGSAGGYVAGPRGLVEWLRNAARSFVFDTAPAPPAVGAALEALRLVGAEPWRRDRVRGLARQLALELRGLGYEVGEPAAAVVPVFVGEAAEAVALSERLLRHGVFVPAIRPPSVPPGTARLRVTAMATHTDEHLERALEAFAAARGGGRASRAAAACPSPPPIDPRILGAGGVFVTGTDTGVGKTVVTALLARLLRSLGLRVAVLKPAQTGTAEGADDAGFVAAVAGLGEDMARSVYRLPQPLAPSVAADLEGAEVRLDRVTEAFADLRRRADVVVVEGAGGLFVPLAPGVLMADVAAALGLPVVVVARPGLGTLNHTALTVEGARGRGLEVVGVVVSGFPPEPGLAELTNPAQLERLAEVELAGVVPFAEGLDVEAGRLPPGLDAAACLGPRLGGRFDREAFLGGARERLRARVAPARPQAGA